MSEQTLYTALGGSTRTRWVFAVIALFLLWDVSALR
jgi:hypothetical protein